MNFQKDIDEIKTNLEGVTRKNNLDEATKDLIENLVYNCPQSNRGISKISEQEDWRKSKNGQKWDAGENRCSVHWKWGFKKIIGKS